MAVTGVSKRPGQAKQLLVGREVALCTEVLGGAAEGGRPGALAHESLLRDTEVGHADVTVGRQQQILRLQVPGEVMEWDYTCQYQKYVHMLKML